jgi:hypothetical protein
MNEHIKVSKDLAAAIGWPKAKYFEWLGHVMVTEGNGWFIFDYRDPVVALGVAERYNAFPYRVTNREEPVHLWKWNSITQGNDSIADTPQKAIALAVIRMLE